jgi:hypothetical protein
MVDEDRLPRTLLPPELAFGHPGITQLRGDYEHYLATKEPTALVDLADVLVKKLGVEPTAAVRDLDAGLQLHVRRHDASDRLLIDVINRDFVRGRGFRPAGETRIVLTLPADYGLRDKAIRALSPDEGAAVGELEWAPARITRREPIREGLVGPQTVGTRSAIKIVLPSVDVYTLVVIE